MTPRPRIVLVDDNPNVLRALARLLHSSCDVIAAADNGEQGIEATLRLTPDIVVVDLTMPDIDGLEICRRIRKSAPETDIIILTAFDDKHVETAAFQAGASAFVAKHAAAVALAGTIQRLMEQRP